MHFVCDSEKNRMRQSEMISDREEGVPVYSCWWSLVLAFTPTSAKDSTKVNIFSFCQKLSEAKSFCGACIQWYFVGGQRLNPWARIFHFGSPRWSYRPQTHLIVDTWTHRIHSPNARDARVDKPSYPAISSGSAGTQSLAARLNA